MQETNLTEWIGRRLVSTSGEKIGKITDIYMDDQTGEPEWLTVSTGLFGMNVSFVPLAEATPREGDICVPYGKDEVKDAPNAAPDGALTQEEEARLYRHYGLEYSEARSGTGLAGGERGDRPASAGATMTGDRSTDDAMTRSEEELKIGKTTEETGRVRLRKWVETEPVSKTVPVTREEVRVEREPITDANIDEAMSGPEISEGEHTEVLHEEQVVTNTNVVPKERVRLDKETVTEEERVEAELRKERIGVEGDPNA